MVQQFECELGPYGDSTLGAYFLVGDTSNFCLKVPKILVQVLATWAIILATTRAFIAAKKNMGHCLQLQPGMPDLCSGMTTTTHAAEANVTHTTQTPG
jgi:hypothetical protein